jgi:hypothetical protein
MCIAACNTPWATTKRGQGEASAVRGGAAASASVAIRLCADLWLSDYVASALRPDFEVEKILAEPVSADRIWIRNILDSETLFLNNESPTAQRVWQFCISAPTCRWLFGNLPL